MKQVQGKSGQLAHVDPLAGIDPHRARLAHDLALLIVRQLTLRRDPVAEAEPSTTTRRRAARRGPRAERAL